MKLHRLTPHAVAGFIIGIGITSTSTILNGEYAFFDTTFPALVGMCAASFYLIIIQADIHARKIKAGIWPSHWQANLLRIAVALAISALFHAYHFTWTKVIDLMLFSACWFGIVFNWALNEFREKPTFYLGKGKRAALTDKIFSRMKYGGELLFLLEAIGMIFIGYIYLA